MEKSKADYTQQPTAAELRLTLVSVTFRASSYRRAQEDYAKRSETFAELAKVAEAEKAQLEAQLGNLENNHDRILGGQELQDFVDEESRPD